MKFYAMFIFGLYFHSLALSTAINLILVDRRINHVVSTHAARVCFSCSLYIILLYRAYFVDTCFFSEVYTLVGLTSFVLFFIVFLHCPRLDVLLSLHVLMYLFRGAHETKRERPIYGGEILVTRS